MKRILHALAALWPKGREHEGPWLPDARNGLLRHAADVMRMEGAIEELMLGKGKLSSTKNQHTAEDAPLPKRVILPIDESDNSDTGNALAMGTTLAHLYLQDAHAQNETTEESTDTNSEPNVKRHFPMPLMSVFLALFMCLLAVQQVSAQSEPAASAAVETGNRPVSPIEGEGYRLPVVTSELITNERQLERIPQFVPDADLERFPVKRYRVQTDSTFKGLRIGDTIPEEVWDLPLWVVNHPEGKDTLTLQDYRDKNLIVLDFWAKFCVPCVESMDKWEGYMEQLDGDVQLIGAQLDFDYKALPAIQEKGWKSPTIIGEGAYLINRLFFQRDVISRMVWIRDGKLLAITSGRGYDLDAVSAAAARQPVEIPIDPLLIYPSSTQKPTNRN